MFVVMVNVMVNMLIGVPAHNRIGAGGVAGSSPSGGKTKLFLGEIFCFASFAFHFRVCHGEGGRPMKSARCDPRDRPV